MKQLLAVGLLYFTLAAVQAQKITDSEVPVIIKEAFAKMYPGIKKASWNKVDTLYIASFSDGHYKGAVSFNNDGKWAERETVISVESVPAGINNYVEKNYKNEKITGAVKIRKSSGEIRYRVAVGNKQILFTQEGDFIKVNQSF